MPDAPDPFWLILGLIAILTVVLFPIASGGDGAVGDLRINRGPSIPRVGYVTPRGTS